MGIFFRICGVDSVHRGGDDQPVCMHILRQQGSDGVCGLAGGHSAHDHDLAWAGQAGSLGVGLRNLLRGGGAKGGDEQSGVELRRPDAYEVAEHL